MTDSNTEQPQQRAARAIADQPTRYAVYDETHKRFVGDVHDTKGDADAARKSGPKGHKLVVREV